MTTIRVCEDDAVATGAVALTPTEFAVPARLMATPGEVLRRRALVESVGGAVRARSGNGGPFELELPAAVPGAVPGDTAS